jgi:hypothetical protein
MKITGDKILSGTARLRNVLKKELAALGVSKEALDPRWDWSTSGGWSREKVPDPPGEILPDLKTALAKDGVQSYCRRKLKTVRYNFKSVSQQASRHS